MLGSASDRRLAVTDGVIEQLGEQRVLLGRGRVGIEAHLLHVGEVARHRGGHLAEHRQHRPLGRLADRFVRRLGGTRERRGDQHRVDQFPRSAGELLGRSADDLAEDHTRVAAGAHQRSARQRIHQLRAADLVDHLAVEAIELVADRAQRQRHVVPGVAVGDREYVQIVDLLAPLLEMCGGRADHAPESLYGGISHTGSEPSLDPEMQVCREPRRPS